MRYTPFESMERMLEQLRRDMLEWRETVADDWPAIEVPAFGPSMDLAEREDEFIFTADLPGFEKDEIDLRVDGDVLVLTASHEETDESTARSRSIDERISLPREVEEDEISATYRNGVLEVHLPIAEGAREPGYHIDIE